MAISIHPLGVDVTCESSSKAILQSGSSLGWWAYKQDPDGIAFRLAKELGWGESDMKNTKDLKQFLAEVPQDKENYSH